MRTFKIRTEAGLSLPSRGITSYYIEDIDGHVGYRYIHETIDVGPPLPHSVPINLGSASTEFQWHDIGADQFDGWVTITGGACGYGLCTMDWTKSPLAEGLHIYSEGLNLSVQVGVSHGKFYKVGHPISTGPIPANWPVPDTTVAIWHPIKGVAPSARWGGGHWALYWGALVLRRLGGGGYGPHNPSLHQKWTHEPDWRWDWYPNVPGEKSHMPDNLMERWWGEWGFSDGNQGETAVAKFMNGGEFARLDQFLGVVAQTPLTYSNDEMSLDTANTGLDSNGLIDNHSILWMLTQFKP